MKNIEILVETQEQVDEILQTLIEAQENDDLNFMFKVEVSDCSS